MDNVADLEKLVVASRDGAVIRLRDIAKVSLEKNHDTYRAMADGNGVVFTRQSQIANRYRIVDAQGAEGHTACNYFTGCIVIDGGSCDFGACQVAQCYVAIARDRTASIVTRRRIVTADHITARAIARQRIEITH